MNVGFNLWWLSVRRPVRLLAPSVSEAAEKKVTTHTLCGFTFYLCTTAVSYWFPVIALVILFGVQVLWIVTSVDDADRDVTTDVRPLVAVESRQSEQVEPSTPVSAHGSWLSTVEV